MIRLTIATVITYFPCESNWRGMSFLTGTNGASSRFPITLQGHATADTPSPNRSTHKAKERKWNLPIFAGAMKKKEKGEEGGAKEEETFYGTVEVRLINLPVGALDGLAASAGWRSPKISTP